MLTYTIILNPFAEEDIKESREWYNLQRENLGEEFLEELKKIVKLISENPFQFPKSKKDIRKAVLDRFPFSVFFFTENEVINIFAVFHASRNPKIRDKRISK